ncbi:glutathione peroxidase [Tranquillimonas rosea]|uniref:glutathione peroxidase n=1 Tax=Tranquillimonas rosea TaxID=641238 RepID=UPI003BAAD1FF
MRLLLACIAALALALPAMAKEPFRFAALEGGTHDLSAWQGAPVLVTNTASLCAFTPQYEGLQALYDRYRDRGLVVLAVPSDDFRQELGSEAEVKEFCELTYGLDLPMTGITRVRGADAHPFYRWLAEAHGFTPRWNFNKVLLGPDGELAATFGSATRPLSAPVISRIEALLSE